MVKSKISLSFRGLGFIPSTLNPSKKHMRPPWLQVTPEQMEEFKKLQAEGKLPEARDFRV